MGNHKELGLFEVRFSCAEEERINPSLLICLSGCNLNCVFCNADFHKPDPLYPKLTRQSWLALADLARKRGARSIGITGGEPLLWAAELAEIMPENLGPTLRYPHKIRVR
jgi:organic radical activating enzyme